MPFEQMNSISAFWIVLISVGGSSHVLFSVWISHRFHTHIHTFRKNTVCFLSLHFSQSMHGCINMISNRVSSDLLFFNPIEIQSNPSFDVVIELNLYASIEYLFGLATSNCCIMNPTYRRFKWAAHDVNIETIIMLMQIGFERRFSRFYGCNWFEITNYLYTAFRNTIENWTR